MNPQRKSKNVPSVDRLDALRADGIRQPEEILRDIDEPYGGLCGRDTSALGCLTTTTPSLY